MLSLAAVRTEVSLPEVLRIRQFIKDNAWGHHASCTCKIGPASDPMTVVDSRFGYTAQFTRRGRLGFSQNTRGFDMTAVYLTSEKASDVIIEDAQSTIENQDRRTDHSG